MTVYCVCMREGALYIIDPLCVFSTGKSVSPPHDSVWTPQQKNALLHPTGNKNKDLENGLEAPVSQNSGRGSI